MYTQRYCTKTNREAEIQNAKILMCTKTSLSVSSNLLINLVIFSRQDVSAISAVLFAKACEEAALSSRTDEYLRE